MTTSAYAGPCPALTSQDLALIADALAERLGIPTADRPSRGALLDVPKAAEYCGLSERSIRHLIATKSLPTVKVGRSVRIRRTDLDLLIANGSVRPDRAGS
jgi:excisionase family DNA binding protein